MKIYEEVENTPRDSLEFAMEITENVFLTPGLNKSFSHEEDTTSASDRKSYRISHEFKVLEREFLMVPKALVLISTQPLFNTFARLLNGLYQISKKKLQMPIECYVAHMVTQIPLPPKGKTRINYKLESSEVTIMLPPCNRLPVLDLNLGVLFNCLDLENVMTLFRDILLEKSTVFISSSEEKLSICTNIVTSLIFPMHWDMVFVPILPHTLLDYLYSPVTFIFGVHSKHIEEIYARVNDSVTIVDLDNNRFLISRKALKTSELPKLPEHYTRKLRKRLTNTLCRFPLSRGKYLKLASNSIDETSNSAIRYFFFQFFVSILIDYKKYMIFGAQQNNSTFNNAAFLQNSSEKEFFSLFLQTQMFSNFCQSRIQPKNIEEHCEGLLFDEEIIAKQNRNKFYTHKGQIVFINDKSEDHNLEHKVLGIDEVFKVDEVFKYSGFPVFSEEVMARVGIPEVRAPRLAERIEKKNASAAEWRTDSECILTAWMDLWGLFLPCQHHSELSIRIQELLSVASQLESTTSLTTIPIYKSLLEVCFNTQPSLALEIYSFMSSSRIPADAETLQLLQKNVSKLYAKDQMILMQNTGTNMVITQASKEIKLDKKLKRTFAKPDDMQVFSKDQIAFIIKETCKLCGKKLKVEEISAKWVRGHYRYESECYWCGELFIPKLTVRIGLEVGYYKRKSHAIREEVLFVSPFVLRQHLNDLILSNKDLTLEQFRCGYSMIFWNCVWYFYKKKLDIDFMLGYDEDFNNSQLFVCDEVPKVIRTYADQQEQTYWTVEGIEGEERKWEKFEKYLDGSIDFI